MYTYIYIYMCVYIYIYMIPLRPKPPPSLWCGVVVGYFPLPCGVVRSGGGSAWGGSPTVPSCGMVWVRIFLWWSAWVFGTLIPMMTMMMIGTMITINIINSNIFIGCLLPTCLVTIIALLIGGPLSS